MEIEAARAVVEETPLPLAARARLLSTHYSTRIKDDRHISRLVQYADSSTTKTGYTERNILTCIEVVSWALQSSM